MKRRNYIYKERKKEGGGNACLSCLRAHPISNSIEISFVLPSQKSFLIGWPKKHEYFSNSFILSIYLTLSFYYIRSIRDEINSTNYLQFLKTSPFPLHIPQKMRWGYKEDKNEGNWASLDTPQTLCACQRGTGRRRLILFIVFIHYPHLSNERGDPPPYLVGGAGSYLTFFTHTWQRKEICTHFG